MSENLWAPWRMQYIRGLEAQRQAQAASQPVCFLCEAAKLSPPSAAAQQALLLLRDERGLVILNRYPYVNGHLLVAPAEHLADLNDLTPVQRAGIIELTALAQRAINKAMNPQGVNIGVNQGLCAGAGLPGHIHFHIVPRWNGDTNFMQTIGQVRVIPQALQESYDLLTQALGRSISDF